MFRTTIFALALTLSVLPSWAETTEGGALLELLDSFTYMRKE
jgi:hypothetical protein